jgi:hypothetical protein
LPCTHRRFIGTQNANDDEVQWPEVPALKVIRVRPGKVALIYENGTSQVLMQRQDPYELLRPEVEFIRIAHALDDVIMLDTKSTLDLVRIRPGNIGLAWEVFRRTVGLFNAFLTPF